MTTLHLLEASPEVQKRFKQRCARFDLDDLQRRFDELKSKKPVEDIAPLDKSMRITLDETSEDQLASWRSDGLLSISQNEITVILVAGGQGSRLGSNLPKALYNIGLPSRKTLLQIQAERIIKLRNLAAIASKKPIDDIHITWCIMTNEDSFAPLREYIERKHFFGLPPQDILLFMQDVLPAFDIATGKILLKNEHEIFTSPNGNGGVYDALNRSGVLNALKQRKCKYVHIYGVDNVLTKVADPTTFGILIQKPKIQLLMKCVERAHEKEAVGTMALRNGHPGIIEYSEIGEEDASKRDKDGHLLFRDGNINSTFLTFEFLKSVCNRTKELPWHRALKTVSYCNITKKEIKNENNEIIDTVYNTRYIMPKEPNAYKMELFLFDILKLAQKSEVLCLLVNRKHEFAPVKNRDGINAKDTPSSARAIVSAYHKELLLKAGVHIIEDNDDDGENRTNENYVEISPLVSYDGEGLELGHDIHLDRPIHIDV